MILPIVRTSFVMNEIQPLLRALAARTRHSRQRWEEKVAEEGMDSLLDHPESLAAIMEGEGVTAVSPKLAFYVMVRHTLLESGLDNPDVADYVAALLMDFAVAGRAYKIARHDDKMYHYVVDLVSELEGESSERRQFLLRAHLGNYSLWLSGLFPDFVVARVHRRGAPGISYYEDMGAAGFRMASQCDLAGHFDLSALYQEFASGFPVVRRALNRVSDRFFFPSAPAPIDRLLRQVIDDSLSN